MKIVKIRVKNFLSISDAEIQPGSVTQIIGNNNQGKTTVLRALEVAMKGSTDGSLVKRGESEAEILLEFDNELTVRRRLTPEGKQDLTVKRGEFKADAPQSLLNGMLSQGTFNPLDVLDPKVRSEALLKAIDVKVDAFALQDLVGDSPIPLPPVDYNQHGLKVVEQAHKYFYQRRAEANKDLKTKEEFVRAKKSELKPIPTDPIRSKAELLELNNALQESIRSEESKASVARALRENVDRLEFTINRLDSDKVLVQNDIASLEATLAEKKKNLEQYGERRADFEAKLALAKEQVDTSKPDQEKIAAANLEIQKNQAEMTLRAEIAAIQSQHEAVAELERQAEVARDFAAGLDRVVDRLGNGAKEELIRAAELPVAGLSFQDGQFLLEGSSIDNLSSSKALRLGVAVARKLSGAMKLICLDGAELLDPSNYEALRSEIEGDGFTYFITKVGEAFPHPGDKVVRMEQGVAV